MEPPGACAQHWARSLAAVRAVVAAFFLGQRALSTPARTRRRMTAVAARATFAGGSKCDLGRAGLLASTERALRLLAGVVVLVMVLAW